MNVLASYVFVFAGECNELPESLQGLNGAFSVGKSSGRNRRKLAKMGEKPHTVNLLKTPETTVFPGNTGHVNINSVAEEGLEPPTRGL